MFELDDKERLLLHIKFDPGCWEWTGALGNKGYGAFGLGGKVVKAHRAFWELFVGPIPEEMFVCHACDNPKCVRPSHLFLGDHNSNMADMSRKLRARSTKLTVDDVIRLRRLYAEGKSQNELSRMFSIAQSSVWNVIHRKSHRGIP